MQPVTNSLGIQNSGDLELAKLETIERRLQFAS
jgi:hypothetical protein